MKVAMAQLDTVVGDLEGNLGMLEDTLAGLVDEAPDLVVFPELFLTGYPPVDILARPWFVDRVQESLGRVREISRRHPGTGLLVGAPVPTGRSEGNGLYNAALLVWDGEVLLEQAKSLLPTYDVFDEARYFDPAPEVRTVDFAGERLGVTICEDAWCDGGLWGGRKYAFDPVSALVEKGATVLINISASPFHAEKELERFQVLSGHAGRHGLPLLYLNLVGGNDELLFDGRSLHIDPAGRAVEVLPCFQEAVSVVDTAAAWTPPDDAGAAAAARAAAAGSLDAGDGCGGVDEAGNYVPTEHVLSIRRGLVTGVRDYMRKCGFEKAVVGLSGGIDSAVVCALAVEALGPENVLGVTMPGPFSSSGSVDDSKALADNLGIEFRVVPIAGAFAAYTGAMEDAFGPAGPDVASENMQARARGNLLMAISNRYGHLLLSTGNKSEMAVGYCTLYGDMSGGLAVISDVPKMTVYELAFHFNREREVIPAAIIDKPPSAELAPDQKDQDTLPPYDILDDILHRYLEEGQSIGEMLESGHTEDVVRWVVRAIHRSEYKRRQAPPGLKVTTKAFGRGRRMAIAARYDI